MALAEAVKGDGLAFEEPPPPPSIEVVAVAAPPPVTTVLLFRFSTGPLPEPAGNEKSAASIDF